MTQPISGFSPKRVNAAGTVTVRTRSCVLGRVTINVAVGTVALYNAAATSAIGTATLVRSIGTTTDPVCLPIDESYTKGLIAVATGTPDVVLGVL